MTKARTSGPGLALAKVSIGSNASKGVGDLPSTRALREAVGDWDWSGDTPSQPTGDIAAQPFVDPARLYCRHLKGSKAFRTPKGAWTRAQLAE